MGYISYVDFELTKASVGIAAKGFNTFIKITFPMLLLVDYSSSAHIGDHISLDVRFDIVPCHFTMYYAGFRG